jgi:hypothetical protein
MQAHVLSAPRVVERRSGTHAKQAAEAHAVHSILTRVRAQTPGARDCGGRRHLSSPLLLLHTGQGLHTPQL